uniref:Uncharacterized protein n=1 Tax=Romanomermis culicivorax TaxID=13658 RepID=A0A915KM34_ROMCU
MPMDDNAKSLSPTPEASFEHNRCLSNTNVIIPGCKEKMLIICHGTCLTYRISLKIGSHHRTIKTINYYYSLFIFK